MAAPKKQEEAKPEKFYTIMISENPQHDSAKGVEYVPVSMQGTKQEWDDCPDCGGKGCEKCKGSGKVPVFEDCLSCEGKGKKRTDRGVHRCSNCGGVGVVPVSVDVSASIMIPRGVVSHNIPQWAIDILKRAIETHYNFKLLHAEDKEPTMLSTRRPSYPFNIIRSYDKPMTDKEIKNFSEE